VPNALIPRQLMNNSKLPFKEFRMLMIHVVTKVKVMFKQMIKRIMENKIQKKRMTKLD